MHMYACASGKFGNSCFVSPKVRSHHESLKEIIWNKEFLMKLLKREDEMRHSPEIQRLYDEGWEKEGIPSTSIEENMQKQLLSEFGIDPEVGLPIFQSYRSIWEDDPDIRNLALYIKYDRSGLGTLREGNLMPDVTLSTMEGQIVKLSNYLKPNRPLVLIGGSYS